MPSMAEMVEAHLANVQREIANLNERKVAIDAEIKRLEDYITEGKATLLESVKPVEPEVQVQPVQSSLF